MKYFYLTLFIALSCSCSKTPSTAYFGGEIVNPSANYVYLYWNNTLIDSSELDANNRFFFNVDPVKEGLYHFDHNEYQYIILEKGDSLLMRLNTLDFDESLVFSGIGAEKNNFLIDMFLIYEDEEKVVNRYSELPSGEFLKKIDSLKAMKENLLLDINADTPLSPMALHIIHGAINYRYFADMEEYPFVHKRRNGLQKVQKLPADFYDFRKHISYSDSLLTYYSPYFNYLVTHFNNMAYNFCEKDCKSTEIDYFQRSLHYSIHKLELIDSLANKNKTIRDNLNRNVAYSYLLGGHATDKNQQFIEAFHKYSPDNQHEEEIDAFYDNVQHMQKGLDVPSIHVVNVKGEKLTLNTSSYEKTTVLYFWNYHQRNHLANVLTRINRLKKDYPHFNYVGINVNNNQEMWLQNLASVAKEDDSLHQYRTNNLDELLSTLVIKNLNKVIIINKNGKIVEGFGNIYHKKHLEQSLKAL